MSPIFDDLIFTLRVKKTAIVQNKLKNFLF